MQARKLGSLGAARARRELQIGRIGESGAVRNYADLQSRTRAVVVQFVASRNAFYILDEVRMQLLLSSK